MTDWILLGLMVFLAIAFYGGWEWSWRRQSRQRWDAYSKWEADMDAQIDEMLK